MTWDPERAGWSPLDPARRCYSCGAEPTHRYSDGSPGYRNCVHPSVVATPDQMARWGLVPTNMRDRLMPALSHTLSPAQIAEALREAQSWEAENRDRIMEYVPPPGWTNVTVKHHAICAEMAASAILRLPRNNRLIRRGERAGKKRPDLGRRTEVRSTLEPGRPLRLGRKDDQPGRLAVLVYGDRISGSFRVVGWIAVRDALIDDYLSDRYTGWRVPPDHLLPLPLPADA